MVLRLGLADRLGDAWVMPAAETDWLAKSTATGHAGRIVCGRLYGVPIAMLQGRVHGYEGLVIADAAVIPTTLGVNPQHTIMALARTFSERLLAG